MRICELRQKEVINICTCRSLGCPFDLEFDPKCGTVCGLIVSGPQRFWSSFFRENELVIPWNCIRQVGKDIILVEVSEELCRKNK